MRYCKKNEDSKPSLVVLGQNTLLPILLNMLRLDKVNPWDSDVESRIDYQYYIWKFWLRRDRKICLNHKPPELPAV